MLAEQLSAQEIPTVIIATSIFKVLQFLRGLLLNPNFPNPK